MWGRLSSSNYHVNLAFRSMKELWLDFVEFFAILGSPRDPIKTSEVSRSTEMVPG